GCLDGRPHLPGVGYGHGLLGFVALVQEDRDGDGGQDPDDDDDHQQLDQGEPVIPVGHRPADTRHHVVDLPTARPDGAPEPITSVVPLVSAKDEIGCSRRMDRASGMTVRHGSSGPTQFSAWSKWDNYWNTNQTTAILNGALVMDTPDMLRFLRPGFGAGRS